jgi:hypothetical protein
MSTATLEPGAPTVPRPQLNMRLDPRSAELMRLLQRRMNLNPTGVMRVALAALAREQGIELPPDADQAPNDADD